ncbi:DUF3887 domain-containing protein [Streptomyces sp. NPDC089919]|uniref:DUF3887 domain-containing protein n=1 Tax=Streptomyces sp. NPDC089919 TaxID=3155188 RepID=UPI00344872F2
MALDPHTGRSLRGLAAAALAASALLAAPGSALAAAPAQPPDRAPLVSTAPAAPSYGQLALDTLDEVVQGDFAAVSGRFAEPLRQQATADVLQQSWTTYQQEFGDYQSHGDPAETRTTAGTVVDIPLVMAKQPGDFRVTFDPDGKLLGLYFLRPGVPVS